MNPSIQHLLKAVIGSLEGEVLPHLDQQAAPASNLRACIMLLANIETRVSEEARILFDDNRELRTVLQDAADNADLLGIEQDLRDSVRRALANYPPQDVYFDVQSAARENVDLQELLTQVIIRLPAAGGEKGAFRRQLHRYLDATGKRELRLAERALARVPV